MAQIQDTPLSFGDSMKHWTYEQERFLSKYYRTHGAEFCATLIDKTERAIINKASKLGLKRDCNLSKRKKAFQKLQSNKEYKVLIDFSEYVNNQTKIPIKHLNCGYIWKTTPNNLSKLSGCPGCSKKGFKYNDPAFLYFIYIPQLDLYKIGITSNWNRRKYDFGYTPIVITMEEFDSGVSAKEAETKLKRCLSEHLYNSGELKNGNTETFIWPS